MQRGDEGLSVLNAEGVDRGPVLLTDARTLQTRRRIALLRVVAVPEREGATQRAEGVVVSLLIPRLRVGDLHQLRMPDPEEGQVTNVRSPDVIENLAARADGNDAAAEGWSAHEI